MSKKVQTSVQRTFIFRGKDQLYDSPVKPTLREVNPDHIILHAGTKDLSTEKRASQMAKATKDLVTSLKSLKTLSHP